MTKGASLKDKNTAGLLALFFGGFGVHKFYLDRPLQGIIYFVFCWTFLPAIISFFESLTYFFNDNAWFDTKYNGNARPSFQNFHVVSTSSAPGASSNSQAVEELEKLATLLDKGILTQSEFNQKKEVILKKIA